MTWCTVHDCSMFTMSYDYYYFYQNLINTYDFRVAIPPRTCLRFRFDLLLLGLGFRNVGATRFRKASSGRFRKARSGGFDGAGRSELFLDLLLEHCQFAFGISRLRFVAGAGRGAGTGGSLSFGGNSLLDNLTSPWHPTNFGDCNLFAELLSSSSSSWFYSVLLRSTRLRGTVLLSSCCGCWLSNYLTISRFGHKLLCCGWF